MMHPLNYLQPEFREELLGCVKAGGHLLRIGPTAACLCRGELGVEIVDASPVTGAVSLAQAGWLAGYQTAWHRLPLDSSTGSAAGITVILGKPASEGAAFCDNLGLPKAVKQT